MSEDNQALDQAIKRVSELKVIVERKLLRKLNVVGVGVGLRQKDDEITDEVVLVVMVSKKVPVVDLKPEDRIPQEIDDVPVDVVEVGELIAGKDHSNSS